MLPGAGLVGTLTESCPKSVEREGPYGSYAR